MRPELRQSVLHEVVEESLGLRAGGREHARPVAPDEGHLALGLPPVEVGPDPRVDLVLLGPRRLGDAEAREEVLDRLDELVLKPVDGSGGKGIVIGPRATRAELDELRVKVMEDPRAWIAQPVVQLSTVPTFVDGQFGPRHVDLRPFAVNDGDRVRALAFRLEGYDGRWVMTALQSG